MKKLLFMMIGLLLTTTIFAVVNKQPMDKVVAIVNDDIITQSELNHGVVMARKQLERMHTSLPSTAQLQKQVLSSMIDKKVELQMASRYGLSISDEELSHTIQNIASSNHMTLDAFHQTLEREGLVWTAYKNELKEQILINKVLHGAVGADIVISQQEIKDAMNSPAFTKQNVSDYLVGDILITLSDAPTSEELQQANKKAADILAELRKGADFKQVAAANSNSPNALDGGTLGWRPLNELPTMFADQVVKMKTNMVAGPLRTGNGLHIIKLLGTKQQSTEHYVTKTHVRHILLITNLASEDNAARAALENIRSEILKGADFAATAKKYSQDVGSANKGGDLSWVVPGMLVPAFENAMEKLKINEISEPVKTQFGWHLIQVLERQKIDDSNAYQHDLVRKQLYQRKFEEQAQAWVGRMKSASYIKIMVDNNG